MAKLRLPPLAQIPPDLLPPELRPLVPAPEPAAGAAPFVLQLGRRQFLKTVGALTALAMFPFTRIERAMARVRGRFFTAHERATLGALVDRVIPADQDPGASTLGAADYIESLVTALDRRRPFIFAGGPYSNRNPYPNYVNGTPGNRRPYDHFRHFLPLTRPQQLYWQAQLFGSSTVPEMAALDAQFGAPLVGLRDVYRQGLALVDAKANQLAGADFVDLPPAMQDTVFDAVDASAPLDHRRSLTSGNSLNFIGLLIMHTLEGCFGVPEYGGNRDELGWLMLGLEGDSQPLGFSIYSTATQSYNDRPDGLHPMVAPNPNEVGAPIPLSADGQRIQNNIATLSNAVAACPP
jgi:hypothetical protein